MKPTVNPILDTRRVKKNGKYPLLLRVIYLREKHDYKTGIDLTQEEYTEAIKERPAKAYRSIAAQILEVRQKAHSIINHMPVFTFQKFEDEYYGDLKSASDIFPFFDAYIENLKKEDRLKTAISYQTARNSLASFKKRLGLYDITADFLRQYHRWMLDNGASETTIGIYLRSLRSVYNYTIDLGVIKKDENYPFGKRKYVIPAGRNIKKALSFSEINAIYNYNTMGVRQLEKARDFWIFSYLCNGINFKDIALLKFADVDGDMLRFVRAKTKNATRGNQTIISCHLSKQARQIISKWARKKGSKDDYLFDILEKEDDTLTIINKVGQFIKNTNKYMKRIKVDLGIEKEVTTYSSRHSAATILKKSGASVHKIQEALGHHNLATTQKYLDSFDDETKVELANSLAGFL